jgi:hypothetical protein
MVINISGHKRRKPFKARTGVKHNSFARPRRAGRFTLPRDNSENALCSLPAEIHHHILSHLPFRVASSYRRICQSYFEAVAQRELSLAGPHISDSIAKLKASIEEIKTIRRPPTDAESFFGCLGLWISRRGTFEGQSDSRRSLQSWFNFVLGGNDKTALERGRWTQLAMEVVSLWRDFLKTSRTPSDTRKQRFMHDSEWSADISADLLGQIWERIYDTETHSQPPLPSTCPEWDVNCREFLTYPNEGNSSGGSPISYGTRTDFRMAKIWSRNPWVIRKPPSSPSDYQLFQVRSFATTWTASEHGP